MQGTGRVSSCPPSLAGSHIIQKLGGEPPPSLSVVPILMTDRRITTGNHTEKEITMDDEKHTCPSCNGTGKHYADSGKICLCCEGNKTILVPSGWLPEEWMDEIMMELFETEEGARKRFYLEM